MTVARAIAPATLAALQTRRARLVFFVTIEADSGTDRYWTGLGTITAASVTWTGAGNLAVIEAVDEGFQLSPYACRFGLSGIPQDVIDLVLQEELFNRSCSMAISALQDDGTLTADPDVVFSGKIRDVDATFGEDDQVLLTAESELIEFERNPNLLYTDRQQQTRYPGDLAFQYIAQVPNSVTVWRGKVTRVGGGYLNRGGGPTRDNRRNEVE